MFEATRVAQKLHGLPNPPPDGIGPTMENP